VAAGSALIPPGGGEIVGDSPDRRVEILSDADPLHATWSRFGPGREGADLHIHHHHTDLFYVLDGELTVRLGAEDRQVAVPPGALVEVPPLVVHGFRNASDADVRYLNFHAPGCGFAGFMRGLRDGTGEDFDQHEPPADGVRPADDATMGWVEPLVDEPGRSVELLVEVDAIAIERHRLEPGVAPAVARPADALYVLEGEALVATGGQELRAEAGAWLGLSPAEPPSISPAGAGPLTLLALRAPNDGA
jgi:mannose-6-phosphate isomerase-like protein (cupin superfamily)